MLCSAIKLTDRKDFKQEKTPKRNKSKMLEEKLFMKSHFYHSYTFRLDKPKRYFNSADPKYLSINNIMLPEGIQTFNGGTSLEKWANKRPRLKSTRTKRQKQKHTVSDQSSDVSATQDDLPEENNIDETEAIETQSSTESEIDPDIQKLLSTVADNQSEREESAETQAKPPRKKSSGKKRDKGGNGKDKAKKKAKTRTIKFSLSKPPSPQTVQVIRVDVTSNYSFEEVAPVETNRTEESVGDCSKGCGKRIKDTNELKLALGTLEAVQSDSESKEISVQCKKLILTDRKQND